MQIMQIIVEKCTVSVALICFSCFLYDNVIKWKGCGFDSHKTNTDEHNQKKWSAKYIKVNGEEIETFAEVSGSQMLLLRKKISKVQIP